VTIDAEFNKRQTVCPIAERDLTCEVVEVRDTIVRDSDSDAQCSGLVNASTNEASRWSVEVKAGLVSKRVSGCCDRKIHRIIIRIIKALASMFDRDITDVVVNRALSRALIYSKVSNRASDIATTMKHAKITTVKFR
jgi:hypothetical protein